MTILTPEEYIETLASPSVNNSRAIVRNKIKKFRRNPSEKLANEIRWLTNGDLQADFLDTDHVWIDESDFKERVEH